MMRGTVFSGLSRSAVVVSGLLMFPLPASAQEAASIYPSKPVRVIVAFPSGNTPDALARTVSQQLSDVLRQPFIVENRPGASGVIAAEVVARAPADGYTLLLGDMGTMIVNPAISAKLPYSPTRDFTPVSYLATAYFYLAVQRSLPASNLNELIALVKSKPKHFNYASTGIGSAHHLIFETLKAETGMDLVHVPYKGGSQAVLGLLAGEVAVMFSGLPQLDAHLKSGGVRILGVASAQRSPQSPDIPTLAELGIRNMDFPGDLGIFAPTGTPRAIVLKLSSEMTRAVHHPDTVKRLYTAGMLPIGGTPEAYAAHFEKLTAKYVLAVKTAGLKAE